MMSLTLDRNQHVYLCGTACNIRGLNTKTLLTLISKIGGNFDLVAVTETLQCNTKTLDLSLNGYLPIFRKDRGQENVP